LEAGGDAFHELAGGGLKGALDFHLKFSTDSDAVGVGDAVPNERAGRVAVEPAGMGYAGFDRSRNRTVGADARVIEVIDEEYHGGL